MLSLLKKSLLFIYILSIYFSPRLFAQIRFEDFLFPLMVLVLAVSITKRIFRDSQVALFYIGYALVITLVYVMSDKLPLKALIIWGKEFQYIIGFMLAADCLDRYPDFLLKFEKLFFLLGMFVAGYFVVIVGLGKIAHYGFTYLTERDSPSLSAWLAFNTFVIFLCVSQSINVSRYVKSGIAFVLFLATVGAGTRTGTLCVIVFLFLRVLLAYPLVHRAIFISVLTSFVLIFAAFSTEIREFLVGYSVVLGAAADRASTLLDFTSTIGPSRGHSWTSVLNLALDTNAYAFGYGRGYTHLDAQGYMPSLGLGADNQYTCNFAELGMVGLTLFFGAIFSGIFTIKGKWRGIYLPYMVAYLLGGMTMEIFQLSKPGQLFWLFTAYLMAKTRQLKESSLEPV